MLETMSTEHSHVENVDSLHRSSLTHYLSSVIHHPSLSSSSFIPPEFTIDLDSPARTRWLAIVPLYEARWTELLQEFASSFDDDHGILTNSHSALSMLTSWLMARLQQSNGGGEGDIETDMAEELQGIANASKALTLSQLCVLHLAYELCDAGCTTIVCHCCIQCAGQGGRRDCCNDANNLRPILARTLDWGLLSLKHLTIQVHYTRSGAHLFSATTFAGYLGVLTAQKNKGYSIAINFRPISHSSSSSNEFPPPTSPVLPIAFAVRRILTTIGSYAAAVTALRTIPILAPCYVIVAGNEAGQGAIITRDKDKDLNLLQLSSNKLKPISDGGCPCEHTLTRSVLIQANMDHWSLINRQVKDVQESRGRVKQATISIIEKLKPSNIVSNHLRDCYVTLGTGCEKRIHSDDTCHPCCLDVMDLRAILHTPPVMDYDTIYTTISCPALDMYHSDGLMDVAPDSVASRHNRAIHNRRASKHKTCRFERTFPPPVVLSEFSFLRMDVCVAPTPAASLLRRSLTILYGSQTGCARETALEVCRWCLREGITVTSVLPMDAIDLAALITMRIVIFVVSTTGNGDSPENMRRLWRELLRRSLGTSLLSVLSYAVFGLGDSGYDLFNAVAKKLDRRLEQIGACRLVERGEGDDQHPFGSDGALIPWLGTLVKAIDHIAPTMDINVIKIPKDQLLSPMWTSTVTPSSLSASLPPLYQSRNSVPSVLTEEGLLDASLATVVSSVRVTAEDWEQDVRFVTLDIVAAWPVDDEGMMYQPGDVVCVMPSNPRDEVLLLLKRLEINPLDTITLAPASTPRESGPTNQWWQSLPLKTTALDYFENWLDIRRSPARHAFYVMSHFVVSPKNDTSGLAQRQQERLALFGSVEGQPDVLAYAYRERRSFYEVLCDFSLVKVPLSYIFELIPPLQPRSFSIASSPSVLWNQIELIVAVVAYKTPWGRPRNGLCSNLFVDINNYLVLHSGVKVRVPIWLKRGLLRLPSSIATPMVMIGPGTGVAPFRSIILSRWHERQRCVNDNILLRPSRDVLVFGCRKQNKDFYFYDDWRRVSNEIRTSFGPVSSSVSPPDPSAALAVTMVAFSRDAPRDDGGKWYVQHLIKKEGQRVWQVVSADDGVVFVAGASNQMPRAVRQAIVRVVVDWGGLDDQQAEAYVVTMEKQKRYVIEVW